MKKYSLNNLGIFHKWGDSVKRYNVSNTGAWSTKEFLPMGCIENNKSRSVLLWQIEHNGSWNWEISDICNSLYLKLSGPSEQENHWWLSLHPNEEFSSVPVAVAFGGAGFDSAVELI